MPQLLSDEEVFGSKKTFSDSEVFGLSDKDVFGTPEQLGPPEVLGPPEAPKSSRSFLQRIWDGVSHPGEITSAEIPFTGKDVNEGGAPQLGEPPPQMVPRFGKEGTVTRGVSETLGGLVEGAITPEGQTMVGGAFVPGLSTAVQGLVYGLAAKNLGEKLGEASVTGSPQTVTEGVLPAMLVAAPKAYKGVKMAAETAKDIKSAYDAGLTRSAEALDQLARSGMRPGQETASLPEVLRKKNELGLAEAPQSERPEMFQAPDLSYTKMLPKEIEVQVTDGLKGAIERYRLATERKAELGEGGELDVSGQTFQSIAETPGFLRTAEQLITKRGEYEPADVRLVDQIDESTPLKTVEELVRNRLEQRDWAAAVADLGQTKPEISRKVVDTLLGVGKKKVPLSAAEETIFNEIWNRALEKTGATPPTSDIIQKLEGLKSTEGYGKASANPFPEIARAVWNTALDIAITAIKAGRTVRSALDEAMSHIRKNARGFDETAVMRALESAATRESKPISIPNQAVSQTETTPRKGTTLEDIYKIFEPEKKERRSIRETSKAAVESVRGGLSSKFRPLDKLAEDVAGTSEPKRIASIMEQLAGSSGKAEADVYRFDRDVTDLVKGNEKDFNAYVFLKRSIDRLEMDAADIARAQTGEEVPSINRRRVSTYTIRELQGKLSALEEKIGPETKAKFEAAADAYQKHMDDSLSLQVESGRMSPEVYQDIKKGNQFYAPFKLLKYHEATVPEGAGRRIDTTADYTKAIRGITDPNFKLGDMLAAARRNITMSRILADKNLAMQRVAELAKDDPEGKFIRRLEGDERAARDSGSVSVMEDGKIVRYEVPKAVEESVKTYNTSANDILANGLRLVSKPFRAGATGFSLVFQPINFLFYDSPVAALVSKYGIKSAVDLFRYPFEWVDALFTAMQPRLTGKASQLYLDFLDSGAAGSTVQDYLRPEALRFTEKSKVGQVLSNALDFGRAIEESNKILGVKRAMKAHGVQTGAELQKQFPEAITEIRRLSGSPDFWRHGAWTEAARLNLIWMFFNARMQGGISVIGRLAGRDGLKPAIEANAKVWTAIGLPSALLYLYNNLPQYADDYRKLPANTKNNYWAIPKDKYITDLDGNKIRDFWLIPKGELGRLVGNVTESGMQFAKEKDPAALWSLGVNLIENLSPIPISGRNTQERIESVVSGLNPLLKAPIEAATGRDTFRHRDIIPSDTMKRASPEQQYTDQTPELFKKLAAAMPDVSPEMLRSPIMLDNLTRNFTAGLITQFLPPSKQIKGREGIETNRFLRRFQRPPYEENPEVTKELESLKREAADEFLKRDRIAKTAVGDGRTLEDAVKNVRDSGDIKLIRRVIDLWISQQNGITHDERAILSLPVEQRAEYVANQLRKMSPDQKSRMLEDYVRKRILTSEVIDEVANKLNNK